MTRFPTNGRAQSASFFWLAKQPSVMKRAVKIALIVGVVLAAINHGDKFVSGTLSFGDIAKIVMTFFVPFSVSTYSSVLVLRERSQFLRPLASGLHICQEQSLK